MMDEHVRQGESQVCKHHQTGYCRYGNQCKKHHNNNLCKEKVCRDSECKERHPKSCRYLKDHGRCIFTNCAYAHKETENNNKVGGLEIELKNLKEELAELRCSMSAMMNKMWNIEQDAYRNIAKPQEKQETARQKDGFKCDQCDFNCSREVTLKKHNNTMHPVPVTQEYKDKGNNFKCDLCDDKFETRIDFNNHIEEHLKEIREMEPTELLNGHKTFKCNRCDFKSRNKNKIKTHLLEHVNQSLPADEDTDTEDNVEQHEDKPYNKLDDYNDDGTPKYIDTETESDTDSSE